MGCLHRRHSRVGGRPLGPQALAAGIARRQAAVVAAAPTARHCTRTDRPDTASTRRGCQSPHATEKPSLHRQDAPEPLQQKATAACCRLPSTPCNRRSNAIRSAGGCRATRGFRMPLAPPPRGPHRRAAPGPLGRSAIDRAARESPAVPGRRVRPTNRRCADRGKRRNRVPEPVEGDLAGDGDGGPSSATRRRPVRRRWRRRSLGAAGRSGLGHVLDSRDRAGSRRRWSVSAHPRSARHGWWCSRYTRRRDCRPPLRR